MNKIYRLVWNKSLQLWTVVSEIARGVTKNRNVTARPGTALSSTAVPSTETHFSFSPTLLLTMICSVMWSGASFAAAGYEAAGGTTYTNCTATSRGSGNRSNASIAIGENACAQGNDTIAMGGGATTQSRDGTVHAQSIAIGKDAQATGDQSIALGANTRAVGDSSVAIGGDDINRLAQDATLSKTYTDITGGKLEYGKYPNTTAQHGATAVGVQAVATGDFASAYGMTSKATGDASAAFGVMSNAAGKGAIAFGAVAQATGDGAAALGINATASGLNSTAIGSGNLTSTSARALAESATAIGSKSLASATETTAIGRDSQATAKAATAVGYNTQATGENSFASGNTSQATGLSASAVGSNTLASGEGSFAGGSRSSARGLASTALGAAANALTDESLALGARATASGEAAIAVGNLTTASGNHALSVGGQSLAEGEQSVSMGYQVKALGNNSTAVGSEAHATETESVALGYKVQALASNTLAAGSQSIADKNGASAMGHLSEAKGEFATAAGAQAWALADRTTALGYYSRASGEDDIAIGSRVVAEGKKSIAIGAESNALAEQDIAIGSNATTAKSNGRNISIGAGTVTGDTGQNVAMGSGSTTANSASSTGGAVAIGRDQKATGDGAVALGDPNTANGNGTVALGRNNTAAGDAAGNTAANGAVAIGNENQAIGQGSVALGNTTTAAAAGAIAMGDTANAQANRSVALGTRSTADSNEAVAIGSGSEATGTDTTQQQGLANRRGAGANPYPSGEAAYTGRATAVGQNNKVTNTGGGTAVGNSNTIDGGGFHNIAIGQGNSTTGDGYNAALGVGNEITSGNSSTAIGVNNRTAGNTAIALGRGTNVLADFGIGQGNTATVEEGATGGISLGNSATTSGIRGIAIGSSTGGAQYDLATAANASGVDSIALGTSAKGTGNQAIAVGRRAKGTGNNAAAYGNEADANGTSSVAVGDKAKAQGDNDIAIGLNAATATGGSNNIAMGNGVTTGATGQNVAMGSGSTTANAASSEGGAVAIGRDQKATGDGAVALGDPNTANGNGTVALGRNNTAAGDTAGNTAANGAVAIGNENQAIGQGSVALGNASTAAEAGSIALGDTANAQAANGVALGSNAVATNADDVALGSGSETSTATGTGYRTGTAAPSSVVSVGTAGNERRIQNLSDGSADTDAVNVRQLRSVQDGVDQLGQSTADALGGGSSYDPTTGAVSNPTYNINGTDTNNVGDALAELDKGWTLQSNGANAGAVKAGDTVDIGTADGEENLQVAKDGNNIKYSLNRDLKVDSVTAGDTVINNDGMTITGGPSVTKDGIDAAGTKVTNVADGTDATDAVNKGQLDQASQDLTDKGFGLRAQDGTTVQKKLGEAVDVVGADPNISTKVENGQVEIELSRNLDIDSVTAGDTVMNTDGVTIANGPSMTKSGIDAAGNKVTNVAAGTEGTDAVNVDQLKTSTAASRTEVEAGKNITVDSSTGADGQTIYTVATADDVEFNSVKVGDVNIDGATGKISGVTDGTVAADSTEAINGSQLHNTAQSTADALGGGSTVNPDGTVSNPTYNINGTDTNNVGDALAELDKGWTLQSNGANSGAVKAGDTVDIGTADGEENLQVAKEGNDIKYSLNRDLNVDSVTAGNTRLDNTGVEVKDPVGNSTSMVAGGTIVQDAQGNSTAQTAAGTTTKNAQGDTTLLNSTGLAFTDANGQPVGPSVSRTGIDAGDLKITNVAPGTVSADSKDAINGSQLHAQGEGVKNIIGGNTQYDPNTGTYTNPDIGGTGQNNINDAIGSISDAATKAKTTVTQGENIVVTESKNSDGSSNYEVATAKDVNFDSVNVGDVNIDGATGKISGVAAGDVNPDSTDAVNGSQLANNAQSVADALGGGSTVNPDGTVSAPNYNVNGTSLNNVGDAITELDKGWNLQSNGANSGAVKAGDAVDIGTADGEENLQVAKEGNDIKYSLNRDLKVDSVTAGDSVINNDGMTITGGPSITKAGINAGNNKITGVAPGTVSADSTDAINGSQLHAQGEGVKNIIGGNTQYDPNTGTYTNPDIGGTGQNNINDAIGSIGKAAAAAKTEVDAGKNMTVDSTTGADGQTIYTVATADDVEFNSVKVGDVNIDGTTGKISGVAAGDVNPDSTDAVNGSQLANNAQSVADALGGGSTVNPDGTVSAPNYNVNGTSLNNVGDAITELDKGWTLQSNGANSGAVKAGDTVDIGTADEEENLQVAKEGNTIKYSLSRDLNVDSVTAGDTLINTDGMIISGGPSVTKAGINAGNKKITGVALGTVSADSTEAINGSQLHAQGEGVKNIIGGNTQYDPNTGKYTNPDIGGTGKDNINDAIGAVGDAAKAAKSTVSNKDGNITVNETTKADGSRDYEVGLAKDIKVDSVTAGGTKVDGDGLHIDGGPSVTKEGIDAGDKKVTGVADGTVAKDSKDAVNGGQLHAQGEGVKDIIGGNTTYDPNTGKYTNTDIGGTGENNINDAIQSVKNDAKAAKTSVSNTDNNLTINKTTKTDGSTDYEVGLADKIKVKQVDADQVNVAGDQGKTSISGGGISITGPKGEQGPSMTTAGINAGGKKVTGVADGAIAKDSQDAVNGSQLHQSYQDVGAALGGGAGYDPAKGWTGPSYEVGGAKHDNVGDALGALDNADKALGDRITNLGDQMQQAFYDTNQRIDDVKKHANAGVAAAMALETAPYISGKYTYAVGAAYHGGENAVGVTLRKTADNGRWSLTTGVAAASQGDPSFRVGLSGVFD